jgi:uncharacterized protein (DUF1501 family)
MNHSHPKRRDMFRYAACAGVGTLGMASAVKDLCITAAAASPFNDYKALICVFLNGGNDQNNMIVPRGSEYAAYATGRPGLALAENVLLPLNQAGGDGRTYGIHPSMTGIQQLFNSGKVAVLANVGPLVAPLNRAQYQNNSVAKPPNLFSHDDQQVHWQTSIPNQPVETGWGGRVGDLFSSLGENPRVSFLMNLSDTNVFQRGRSINQLRMRSSGVIGLNSMSAATTTALNNSLNLPYGNLMQASYRDIMKLALDNNQFLAAALNAQPALTTVFPNTGLANQLRMVARLIQSRAALGMQRQIFFVQQGGYDTHGPQLTPHANLLRELSDAMSAFYAATNELGVADQVTQFTASDFGRTLRFNGEGSDHGWGSHHFIVGGAVRGQRLYGTFQNMLMGGPDDTSQGRYIPTTSVDQYAATLAKWFGVSVGRLPDLFPNLRRFNNQDLGFLL